MVIDAGLSPGDGFDKSDLEAMVREHSPAVHAYLSRRVARPVADDLLGEVWLRAVGSWENLDPAWDSPRPWLYGIARNVLRGYWRQELRVSGSCPTMVDLDPWARVDERLDSKRLSAALREGLAGLAERDREILLLVAWEGLNSTEIAVVLEIRPGTVRSGLHRARRQLQDFLNSLTACSYEKG